MALMHINFFDVENFVITSYWQRFYTIKSNVHQGHIIFSITHLTLQAGFVLCCC